MVPTSCIVKNLRYICRYLHLSLPSSPRSSSVAEVTPTTRRDHGAPICVCPFKTSHGTLRRVPPPCQVVEGSQARWWTGEMTRAVVFDFSSWVRWSVVGLMAGWGSCGCSTIFCTWDESNIGYSVCWVKRYHNPYIVFFTGFYWSTISQYSFDQSIPTILPTPLFSYQ